MFYILTLYLLMICSIIGNFFIFESTKGKEGEELKRREKINYLVSNAFPFSIKLSFIFATIIIFSNFITLFSSRIFNSYVINLFSMRFLIRVCLILLLIYPIVIAYVSREKHNISEELYTLKPTIWLRICFVLFIQLFTITYEFIPFANRILDFSNPREENVIVASKRHVSKRKSPDSYNLIFNQIIEEVNEIEVSHEEYMSVSEGDQIKIKIYNGLFGLKYKGGSIEKIIVNNNLSKEIEK